MREPLDPPASDDDPRPTPPDRPDPDECCRSACDHCIFDLHEDAMDRYRERLRVWLARHADAASEPRAP
ncbi:MAG: oxidoreductase-like domain-containing protein [Casimicrobiaceae bacterium]